MFAPAQGNPHDRIENESDVVPVAETDLEHAVQVFLAERSRLFRIAYRVIGNVAGAEDVVQEAWLRWQRTDRDEIHNPAAFLTTATTHLAINVIQSARHRHETPIGSPVADLAAPPQDPMDQAERTAAVEATLGMLMARLTQSELAAYLLRKGFDYPYRDIALVLQTSVENARQLVRRAQGSISAGRTRRVDPDSHRRLVGSFLFAGRTGDLSHLENLLANQASRTPRCPAASRADSASDGTALGGPAGSHSATPSRSA